MGTIDYFRTTGTRVLRGRVFSDADAEGGAPIMVVSNGMARVLWPGRDAVGQCVRVDGPTEPCRTVVGIAEDVRINALNDAREYTYYLPAAQYAGGVAPQLFVRINGHASAFVDVLRKRLQVEMPGAAYVTAVPLEQIIAPQFFARRFGATMFLLFGLLALTLAAFGLHSIISDDLAQRRQEMGVRRALGASVGSLVSLVVGQATRRVARGVGLGVAIARAASRQAKALMFNQSTRDPLVFGLVAACLLVVAGVASAVPAFRAANADPGKTLRAD